MWSWGLLAGGDGRELCGFSYSLMDHCKLYFWPVECELQIRPGKYQL